MTEEIKDTWNNRLYRPMRSWQMPTTMTVAMHDPEKNITYINQDRFEELAPHLQNEVMRTETVVIMKD